MRCPPEIADVLCEILRIGLLRIRTLVDPSQSSLHADHLHNLPGLLADFRPELLEYYWHVERAGFTARCQPGEAAIYESAWASLVEYVQATSAKSLAG